MFKDAILVVVAIAAVGVLNVRHWEHEEESQDLCPDPMYLPDEMRPPPGGHAFVVQECLFFDSSHIWAGWRQVRNFSTFEECDGFKNATHVAFDRHRAVPTHGFFNQACFNHDGEYESGRPEE